MLDNPLRHAPALPQARRIEQHRPGPAIDVKFLNQPTHAAHTHALLVRGHDKRAIKRLGTLLAVIRIHEQRVVQLARSSGELREHQHALLVVPGRDKFLGDQIHPVMEARHHAHIGGAIVLVDDLRRMVLNLQVYRLITVTAESSVDASGERTHPRLEMLIFLERRTRWRCNLHEDEAADELRMLFEQTLDGEETLEDALGVIHPVYTDPQEHVVLQLLDT